MNPLFITAGLAILKFALDRKAKKKDDKKTEELQKKLDELKEMLDKKDEPNNQTGNS